MKEIAEDVGNGNTGKKKDKKSTYHIDTYFYSI